MWHIHQKGKGIEVNRTVHQAFWSIRQLIFLETTLSSVINTAYQYSLYGTPQSAPHLKRVSHPYKSTRKVRKGLLSS